MDLHFTVDKQVEMFLSDLARKSKKTITDFAQEIFLEALEEKHEDAWQ